MDDDKSLVWRAEEKLLVQRAQRGDKDAFGKLIEHYTLHMGRRACFLLGNRGLEEDAVQDALFDAWRWLRTLDPDRSFWPWLHKILSRCCYRIRRRENKQRGLDIGKYEFPCFDPDITLLLDVGNALRELERRYPKGALVIEWLCLNDEQLSVIAEQMHEHPVTVRSWLCRGRQILRELLPGYGTPVSYKVHLSSGHKPRARRDRPVALDEGLLIGSQVDGDE